MIATSLPQLALAADAPPSREAVLNALGKDDPAGDLHLEIKSWKALDGAFAALLYIDAGEVVGTKRLLPTLAVLRSAEGKPTIIAQSEIDETRCRELPEAGELMPNENGDDCQEMHLDLAPYRITPSTTALGLRTMIHSVFGAGEDSTQYLTLYEVLGEGQKTLRPIFSHEMSASDEQRGSGDLSTAENTLRISDHSTAGYFDLILDERVSSEKIGDSGKPRVKRVEHRFIWEKGGYRAAK